MESDPDPNNMTDFSGSSLLHANNLHIKRAINLEWRPEEDFDGEFILRVINLYDEINPRTKKVQQTGDWKNPHVEFSSRDRLVVVAKIEQLMLQLTPFEDPRIMKSEGVVFEEAENLRLKLKNESISDDLVSKIINIESKQLHLLLIDHPDIQRNHLENLIENGAFQKIAKRASQKLNSKTFRNQD